MTSPKHSDDERPLATPFASFNFPILFALLPPLGSLFIGSTDTWADGLMLSITAFYLYQLHKIPWDLYEHVHAQLPRRRRGSAAGQLPADQQAAISALISKERLLLFLVVISPILGGLTLFILQKTLLTPSSNRYLTPANIALYVFAASLRPLSQLIYRIRTSTDDLAEQRQYPEDAVNALLSRLDMLELEIRDLRHAAAGRTDLEDTKIVLEGNIETVAKAARQFGKMEERNHRVVEERQEAIESRLRQLEEWCELQRVEAVRQSLMVRCVWEPVQVLKEAVGVGRMPLIGFAKKEDE